MSSSSSKILVPIGFSDQSVIAFDQACSFAKLDNAKVFLLSVVEERSTMQNLFLDDNSHELKRKFIRNSQKLHQNILRNISLKLK